MIKYNGIHGSNEQGGECRLIGGMVKHFAAHPGKLDSVFDLEDGFSKTIWMNNCIETLRKDPASAKMLDERYMGPEYNLAELLKLQKNSL
jgi:ubiquinone biosynthesis protein Coq4